ncbi:hypothetical protein ABLN87_00695 [Ruegeria sp. SCPT10]|uniref:hypothetical protein n=1 Tax=Ruegeria sp. SCP10 TaxID=3141377 RepID=UPI003339DFC6
MVDIAAKPNAPWVGMERLVALILAVVLGFALGQSLPLSENERSGTISQPVEDWHGNVRRSTWPD